MKQVVEVDLPVPLGIDIHRQADSCQLARHTLAFLVQRFSVFIFVEHFAVTFVSILRGFAQRLAYLLGFLAAHPCAAPLAVGGRLRVRYSVREQIEFCYLTFGNIKFVIKYGIPRRILVDAGGAVTDPLAGYEDWQFDVQFDLAHLERRGVAMPHEIADQVFIVARAARACPVGHAGRLHDRRVVAHIVDDADKPAVKDPERFAENTFQRRDRRATRDRGSGCGRLSTHESGNSAVAAFE